MNVAGRVENFLPRKALTYELPLAPDVVLTLQGPNGIGKSSFIQYLKKQQQFLFAPQGIVLSFMDQFPLRPLGDLRGRDLLQMLQENFASRVVLHGQENAHLQKLIEDLGMGPLLEQPILSLSGGENQALKIITTFMLEAQLYILDEPTQSLDVNRINVLREWIGQWQNHRSGKMFLIIEHDELFLRSLYSRPLFMSMNKKIQGELQIAPMEWEK